MSTQQPLGGKRLLRYRQEHTPASPPVQEEFWYRRRRRRMARSCGNIGSGATPLRSLSVPADNWDPDRWDGARPAGTASCGCRTPGERRSLRREKPQNRHPHRQVFVAANAPNPVAATRIKKALSPRRPSGPQQNAPRVAYTQQFLLRVPPRIPCDEGHSDPSSRCSGA